MSPVLPGELFVIDAHWAQDVKLFFFIKDWEDNPPGENFAMFLHNGEIGIFVGHDDEQWVRVIIRNVLGFVARKYTQRVE